MLSRPPGLGDEQRRLGHSGRPEDVAQHVVVQDVAQVARGEVVTVQVRVDVEDRQLADRVVKIVSVHCGPPEVRAIARQIYGGTRGSTTAKTPRGQTVGMGKRGFRNR